MQPSVLSLYAFTCGWKSLLVLLSSSACFMVLHRGARMFRSVRCMHPTTMVALRAARCVGASWRSEATKIYGIKHVIGRASPYSARSVLSTSFASDAPREMARSLHKLSSARERVVCDTAWSMRSIDAVAIQHTSDVRMRRRFGKEGGSMKKECMNEMHECEVHERGEHTSMTRSQCSTQVRS